MAKRTTTQAAGFHGGGPADGERRVVEDDTTTVVVDEPPSDLPGAPAGVGHLYERQPDGRFQYAGAVAYVEQLPVPVAEDTQSKALAVLGTRRAPHPVLVLAMIVLVAGVVFAFDTWV
jgi:hypothetical protein